MGGGGGQKFGAKGVYWEDFSGGERGMSKFPASEGDSPHPSVGKTLDLTGSNC